MTTSAFCRHLMISAWVGVTGVVSAPAVWAWQPAPAPAANAATNDQPEHRRWTEYYQRAAAAYKFAIDKDSIFELQPEPIHKYTHPSGLEGTHGAFFVWTRQGCPEVVGSIWSYEIGGAKRSVVHEFHSLATQPLQPVTVGEHRWRPTGGLLRQPLENSPWRVTNAKLRLIKMRQLAREFTGYVQLDDKEVKLRLHQKPLFRYVSTTPRVIDGAMFCMFNEWDPEILLLIEALPGANGPQWYFAAARFNVCPLRLHRGGNNVWQVDRDAQVDARFGDPAGPFFAVHAVDVREATASE